MSDAPAPRRRFRFGMRALLGALTLAAVASWLSWYGWPRYVIYREQVRFETAVKQITIGMNTSQIDALVSPTRSNWKMAAAYHSHNRLVARSWYRFPNANYVIFCPLRFNGQGTTTAFPFESVEVFRISVAPPGYSPKTDFAKPIASATNLSAEEISGYAHVYDFIDYLNSDRSLPSVIPYTLIHSDMPSDEAVDP